ncbi:MAG: hypothetical protein A2Y76_09020 [Planctomycetes bacterium RBG_13_60_9]|nr:MAG: hypothetical protein A2Y76_09020 [Planctomycetes bacterium RBG_13_60_9]
MRDQAPDDEREHPQIPPICHCDEHSELAPAQVGETISTPVMVDCFASLAMTQSAGKFFTVAAKGRAAPWALL